MGSPFEVVDSVDPITVERKSVQDSQTAASLLCPLDGRHGSSASSREAHDPQVNNDSLVNTSSECQVSPVTLSEAHDDSVPAASAKSMGQVAASHKLISYHSGVRCSIEDPGALKSVVSSSKYT